MHLPDILALLLAEDHRVNLDNYLKERGIFIGMADVDNCFHRVRLPYDLSRFFCLKPLSAEQLGMAGVEIDGLVLGEEFTGAAAGFSWQA